MKSLVKMWKKFASVKIPVVGGKSSLSMLVKIPRCVEQQVASTSVSVSKLSSTSSQEYSAKKFSIRMAALWTTWASTCSRWWASCRPQTSLCLWSVSVEIELVWFVSSACRILHYQQQLVENGSRIFPSY